MIQVTLRADRATYSVGDVPDIEVRIRNISASPMLFIGVLEGSEFGLRFPHYLPMVDGPVDVRRLTEAPDFTAPVRASDVRTLQPGEEFDPTDAANGARYIPLVTFEYLTTEPGQYTVTLTVSTACDDTEPWLGTLPTPRDPAAPSLIAQIPRLTVHSNPLTIEVRAR